MMKKITAVLSVIFMCILLAACGTTGAAVNNTNTHAIPDTLNSKKVLIAYFSRTGTTENIAELIRQKTSGDIFKIEAVNAYPSSYKETTEVAKKEKDNNIHPDIKMPVPDIKNYDVIFIGYPIWWHDAPMAIYTFMEKYDFSGKIIIPFCTSGGSDIEESMPGIISAAGSGKVFPGFTANRPADVEKWLETLGF